MPFVDFRKKFRFFSFHFRQNFDVRTFPRWLSIRETKFFWCAIQIFFFFKIFNLVLLNGFLDGFWKFRLFIVKICILIWYFWVFFKNYRMRMLSIRGNDLSHAEHTRNQFHRTLSIRGTNFRACSASCKMWTVFNMYNTCSAYVERILSHTEHTRNKFHRMLSIRGTDFIACW
jgi:hypothetical protein